MRLAAVLFAGLIGLLTASAQSPLSKLEHTPLFGNDYVRLTDWAKAFNFQIRWMRQSEDVQLTNAWARLVFTLDSHRAEINGVAVFQKAIVKSLPVEDRGVKHARFAVLRSAPAPAVLVEAGFMTHPQESKRILDPDYRRQLARAIADGVLAYKRLVER